MTYIVVSLVLGAIIIIIAVFFIIRYIKKKKSDINYIKDMKTEELMSDI